MNCGWLVDSCVIILRNVSGICKYGTARKFAVTDCIVHDGLSSSFGPFKKLRVLITEQKNIRKIHKQKKLTLCTGQVRTRKVHAIFKPKKYTKNIDETSMNGKR